MRSQEKQLSVVGGLEKLQLSVVSCPLSVVLDDGASRFSSAGQKRGSRIELRAWARSTDNGHPTTSLASGFRWCSVVGVSTATGYRYIIALPGVRGGRPHVEGTRIGVHDVVAYHLLGCPVEEICGRFPDLTRAQIYECLAYYEDHRGEIETLALSQLETAGE